LREDSYWSGTFSFRPPHNLRGDVQVTITKRAGDQFWGVYTTEHRKHEWSIQGTVGQGTIHWEFTHCNRNIEEDKGLVGNGSVDGTYAGEEMTVVFRDEGDQSVADMKLRLQK